MDDYHVGKQYVVVLAADRLAVTAEHIARLAALVELSAADGAESYETQRMRGWHLQLDRVRLPSIRS